MQFLSIAFDELWQTYVTVGAIHLRNQRVPVLTQLQQVVNKVIESHSIAFTCISIYIETIKHKDLLSINHILYIC